MSTEHWTITRELRKREVVSEHSPGVDALRAFYRACEDGKPGTYHLTGMAARREVVLARAIVRTHELAIAWSPEWILFSLGAKGMHDAMPDVVAYLRDVWAFDELAKHPTGDAA